MNGLTPQEQELINNYRAAAKHRQLTIRELARAAAQKQQTEGE